MRPKVRLAIRDWDFVTPLLLGDVASERIDLTIDRVNSLPDRLLEDGAYDAAEISLSQHVLDCASGMPGVHGHPCFIMRGFRHRTVLTRKDAPIRTFADLAGKRIGLTGWQDTGNVWARAHLARAGMNIANAQWFVGRLLPNDPPVTALGHWYAPGHVEPLAGQATLPALLAGELDAVFAPFLPADFFRPDSHLRHVLDEVQVAERVEYEATGYVPGIHLLGVRHRVVAEFPWIASELARMIDEARRLWKAKRQKYADTTPWLPEAFHTEARDLDPRWDESGMETNRTMVADFIGHMRAQGILDVALDPGDLFPSIHSHEDAPI